MATGNTSFFEKAYNPVLQATLIFGAVLVVNLLSKLVKLSGIIDMSERFPWMIAAAFMLFYAMFNSVFSLSAKNMAQYWSRSIYSYMGLAAASGLAAYLFSSLAINEAGSFRWIYIVLTIGYLVFLCMMTFIKYVVEYAQKEEWKHPRIRNKKKKK